MMPVQATKGGLIGVVFDEARVGDVLHEVSWDAAMDSEAIPGRCEITALCTPGRAQRT